MKITFKIFMFLLLSTNIKSFRLSISCSNWDKNYDELNDTFTCNISRLFTNRRAIVNVEEHKNNSKVTSIIFQSCQIFEIPEEVCKKFPNLRVINAQNSKIQSLNNSTFQHAKKLRDLDLSENRVQILNDATFFGLDNLNFLILRKNEIRTVEPFALSGLFNLLALDLSFNKISELPALIFSQLQKIEKIILTNNQLETLDDHLFAFNDELSEIYLDKNNLMSTGKNVFSSLRNLKQLVLSFNSLKNIYLKDFSGNFVDIRENEVESAVLSKTVETFHAEGQKIKILTLYQHDDLDLRKFFMNFESLQEIILYLDQDFQEVNALEINPVYQRLINKLKERNIVREGFHCSIASHLDGDISMVKIRCVASDYEEYAYVDSD